MSDPFEEYRRKHGQFLRQAAEPEEVAPAGGGERPRRASRGFGSAIWDALKDANAAIDRTVRRDIRGYRENPRQQARDDVERSLRLARGLSHGVLDTPLMLMEQGVKLGSRIDRALGIEQTGGATRAIQGVRRGLEGFYSQGGTSGWDAGGRVAGSLLGFGGAYGQVEKAVARGVMSSPRIAAAAEGTGRVARLARLARSTGRAGRLARGVAGNAPVTALLEAPDRELSTAHLVGGLLEESDSPGARRIGGVLEEASRSPGGRLATGLTMDLAFGGLGTLGRYRGPEPAAAGPRRARRSKAPRLADQAAEAHASTAETAASVADAADEPAVARAADAQRRLSELEAEREALRRGTDRTPETRARARELDRQIDQARADTQELTAVAEAAVEPSPIGRALGEEWGPSEGLDPDRLPVRGEEDEGDAILRLGQRRSDPGDPIAMALEDAERVRPYASPYRNAPTPDDFAELDRLEQGAEIDAQRRMLEQVDASSRMNPVDDVRATSEEQAAARAAAAALPEPAPYVEPPLPLSRERRLLANPEPAVATEPLPPTRTDEWRRLVRGERQVGPGTTIFPRTRDLTRPVPRPEPVETVAVSVGAPPQETAVIDAGAARIAGEGSGQGEGILDSPAPAGAAEDGLPAIDMLDDAAPVADEVVDTGLPGNLTDDAYNALHAEVSAEMGAPPRLKWRRLKDGTHEADLPDGRLVTLTNEGERGDPQWVFDIDGVSDSNISSSVSEAKQVARDTVHERLVDAEVERRALASAEPAEVPSRELGDVPPQHPADESKEAFAAHTPLTTEAFPANYAALGRRLAERDPDSTIWVFRATGDDVRHGGSAESGHIYVGHSPAGVEAFGPEIEALQVRVRDLSPSPDIIRRGVVHPGEALYLNDATVPEEAVLQRQRLLKHRYMREYGDAHDEFLKARAAGMGAQAPEPALLATADEVAAQSKPGQIWEAEGVRYQRTATGWKRLSRNGKPTGNVLSHEQLVGGARVEPEALTPAERMVAVATISPAEPAVLEEAVAAISPADPLYIHHRATARGITNNELLVERALSLARQAERIGSEATMESVQTVVRSQARAYADEAAVRGLDVDLSPPPTAGFARPGMIHTLAEGGVGAAAGAALDDENPLRGAALGAVAGVGLGAIARRVKPAGAAADPQRFTDVEELLRSVGDQWKSGATVYYRGDPTPRQVIHAWTDESGPVALVTNPTAGPPGPEGGWSLVQMRNLQPSPEEAAVIPGSYVGPTYTSDELARLAALQRQAGRDPEGADLLEQFARVLVESRGDFHRALATFDDQPQAQQALARALGGRATPPRGALGDQGFATPGLTQSLAGAGVGATGGAALDPDNPLRGAAFGAVAGGALVGARALRAEARAFADEVIERGLVAESRRSVQATTAAGATLAALVTHPAALKAQVGAAAGALSGEEDGRLKSALVGAAVLTGGIAALKGLRHAGQAIDAISFLLPKTWKGAGRKTESLVRIATTARGDLPAATHHARIEGNGRTERLIRGGKYILREFDRAAKEAYGGLKYMTDAEIEQIDLAFKGAVPVTALPAQIQPHVTNFRNYVDQLTEVMINEGVVAGPMAAAFDANKGFYARRSYQVFDDPSWAAKVDPAVKNRAEGYLRAEFPSYTDEQIQGALHELLYRAEGGPMAFLAQRPGLSKSLGIVTERKDIAPEIRALWGEYGDARVNFMRSVADMSDMIGKHQVLTETRAAGLGSWLHEQPVVRGGDSYHAQIVGEGSEALAPLNGLYTTPEIKVALTQAFGTRESNPWLRGYMSVVGAVKVAKTVGSVQATLRNFVSNTGFAMAQGLLNKEAVGAVVGGAVGAETGGDTGSMVAGALTGAAAVSGARRLVGRSPRITDAFRTVAADLAGSGPKAVPFQRRYQRYLELGVVSAGAQQGELQAVLRDASERGYAALYSPVQGLTQRGLQAASTVYRLGDDVWKIFHFEQELSRYAKAMPDLPRPELEKRAAEVVRKTHTYYDMVPGLVRGLRRAPMVGTFVSFPAEVVRIGKNTVQLIAEEMKDPATRAIAMQRAFGVLAAAAIPVAAGVASRNMAGVTPKQEAAMRYGLPPWDENAQLIHLGRDARGRYRYVNVGFTNPWAYWTEPVLAVLRNDETWEQKAADVSRSMLQPFVGEDIFTSAILDVARNKNPETTKEVYNPQAPLRRRMREAGAHVWKALEPGTMTSAKRIYKAATGEESRGGQSYNLNDELVSISTGQRRQLYDPQRTLSFQIPRWQDEMKHAEKILNGALRDRRRLSPEEIERAYEDTETSRRKLFDRMHQRVVAVQMLGMSRTQVYQMLREAQVSQQMASSLMLGRYVPYRPSGEMVGNIQKSFQLSGRGGELRERVGTVRQAYLDRSRRLRTEAAAAP